MLTLMLLGVLIQWPYADWNDPKAPAEKVEVERLDWNQAWKKIGEIPASDMGQLNDTTAVGYVCYRLRGVNSMGPGPYNAQACVIAGPSDVLLLLKPGLRAAVTRRHNDGNKNVPITVPHSAAVIVNDVAR